MLPSSRIDCLHPLAAFFFCTATAPSELYTLSLHDALPIWPSSEDCVRLPHWIRALRPRFIHWSGLLVYVRRRDRKSTRLNSSHRCISYAVFCLKKKKTNRVRDGRPHSVIAVCSVSHA